MLQQCLAAVSLLLVVAGALRGRDLCPPLPELSSLGAPRGLLDRAQELQREYAFVNLLFVDAAMVPMTESFLCNWQALKTGQAIANRTLAMALDKVAYAALASRLPARNVFALSAVPPFGASRKREYGAYGFWYLMLVRTRLQMDLLAAGVSFLQIEPDQVWFQDPLPHLEARWGQADLVSINDHDLPGRTSLTGGFLLYKATSPGVREALASVLDDQARLLRTDCRSYELNEQVMLTEHARRQGLRVVFLDPSAFQSGLMFNAPSPRAVVVHNNWLVGVAAKVERAKRASYRAWFLDERGACVVAF